MSGGYVLRRLAVAAVTVFLAATLNFVIFRAAPGDVASALKCRNCTVELKEALREEFGLGRSKLEQYGIYLKELAQGNLGRSFVTQQPVWDELKGPIVNTLPMLALATVFAIVVGVAMGVIAAWRRGTFAEWANVGTSLFFYAMPTQWLGLMLVIAFAGVLPVAGISDPFLEFTDASWWDVFVDRMKHMLLPALTLGLVLTGDYSLVTRSALLQTMGDDYVLTARAKGLPARRIVRRHVLRNAWLPIVSQIALSIGYLVGGSILVEAVFSYPGIGLETYDAVLARDYPVLQGAFLFLVLSVVLCNLIADLLYPKLDPRIAR